MSKKFLVAAGLVLCFVLGFNVISAERHAYAVGRADERNRTVSIYAYHHYGVLPGSLVIDIRSVDDGAAPLDVLRYVFQIAERLKDRTFDEVRFAYRGETRFILSGSRFKTIGTEHGTQNPMYVLRTLPQDLRRPDGRRAYDTWTGGMLGVLGKQMEDLNDFTSKWFRDAETTRRLR